MPVYVVNMGSGGMNGNTGGLPDTPDSSRNPAILGVRVTVEEGR